MTRRLYLCGIEKRQGKSFVALGVASALASQSKHFRCFKLFDEPDKSQWELLSLVSHQPVNPLMSLEQALQSDPTNPEDLIAQILNFINGTGKKADIELFEGSDFESDNASFELQFNLGLAQQLDTEVLFVISARDRDTAQCLSLLRGCLMLAQKQHTRVLGVVFTRTNKQLSLNSKNIEDETGQKLPYLALIPEFEEFSYPDVANVVQLLQGQVLCGKNALHRPVKQLTVAAKTVGNFLESRLDREGMIIITPYDRVDILLGSLLADQSAFYPKIAGMVLTGGDMPGEIILKIISGLENPFPVILTTHRTFETATMLDGAHFRLDIRDKTKFESAMLRLIPYLSGLVQQILSEQNEPATLTPALFLFELEHKARDNIQHIVLPEGTEPRILEAAHILLQKQCVRLSLLGDKEKIQYQAKRLALNLEDADIIDIERYPRFDEYVEQYYTLRQHKGVNRPIARERLCDPNYFAAMMVYNHDADGMVSGAIHTTADTVRPALEIIKTKPGSTRVSSLFIMCMATKILIYADCAINPDPDSHLLANIAISAADMAQKLGIHPKVALLSYSSGDSGHGESVDKVVAAFEEVKRLAPTLEVEGPIQYDAAVDKKVAKTKMPRSKVAGVANVLIFPDLNTGNNTYKAVQRESGAMAIGPVLLGLNRPVNDLSRGCTVSDIVNTVMITALQAQGNSK